MHDINTIHTAPPIWGSAYRSLSRYKQKEPLIFSLFYAMLNSTIVRNPAYQFLYYLKKLQATSYKLQATSYKLQATSYKLQAILMAVPKFLQSALWSCPVSELDKNRDKGYIVPQILNHGSWDQIRWTLKTYRPTTIKKYLKYPRRGCWYADNLRYWTTIYNVHPSPRTYERALFSLTPTNLPLPRRRKL